MRKNPEVSVIIVHFGAFKEVFECIKSLKIIKQKFRNTEFILVDNDEIKTVGSQIKKKNPWINYIPSPRNLGFGGGRNLGRKYARGDYLLCLDSDVTIDYKSFKKLVNFIKNNKSAGLVSPSLRNISGKYTPQATMEMTPLRGIFWLSFINKIWPGNPVTKDYMMESWDRSDTREVEVGQVGGFIIRKKAFDEIGGFDERMFLYFEENDLAMNLQKVGWNVYFYPEAEVIHLESKGTPKSSDRIKKVFSVSRYRYFSKHYGIFNALLVEFFARISFYNLALAVVILLAAFLRFYRINENIIFHGEVGYDYLSIREMIRGERTFLLGPRTSHEWLSLSPLFYWIFAVLLPLGNYHPAVGSYFFAFMGVAAVIIAYLFVQKFIDKTTALLTSFLLAISPAWVGLARNARFNSISAVLFFPYLYYLVRSLEKGGKYFFWLGMMMGLMYHFFATSVILIPVTAVIFILKRKQIKFKSIIYWFSGIFIPNIPFFLYNLLNRFEMAAKLALWVPYRILGFFGLYPKNTVNSATVQFNLTTFYTFFRENFLAGETPIFFLFFTLVILYQGKNILKKIIVDKSIFWFCFTVVLIVTFLGIFVLGDAPIHYYYVIFPIPIILAADFFVTVSKEKYGYLFSATLISAVVFINLKYYFSDNWFYQPENKIGKTLVIPLRVQESIAEYIFRDAQGKDFELRRIGPWDNFAGDFSQNYIYLLERMGNSPVDEANLIYTIYEDKTGIESAGNIKWFGDIAVTKEIK